jgi:hypothetical protein
MIKISVALVIAEKSKLAAARGTLTNDAFVVSRGGQQKGSVRPNMRA